jgi:hypothetical protein
MWMLVGRSNRFDTVKPKTRAHTTVLEALDRLHAGFPQESREIKSYPFLCFFPI